MDNYLESYHVPIGHPGLYRMFTPDYDDQASVARRRAGSELAARAALLSLVRAHVPKSDGPRAAHLPEAQRRCWRFYSALPNLGIDVFPDQMDFFQVLPAGPGKCIVRGTTFGLPDASPELRAVRFLSNRINTQVNNEDKWLCQRVQRGLASSSYKPGPLSRLERYMHRVPQSAARAHPGVSVGARTETVRLAHLKHRPAQASAGGRSSESAGTRAVRYARNQATAGGIATPDAAR